MTYPLATYSVSMLLVGLLLSPQSHALTLKEAVIQSLDTQPTVEASQLRIGAAEDRALAAKMGYLPSLTLNGGVSRHASEGGSSMYGMPSNYDSKNFSIGVSLPLFNGFATHYSMLAAQAGTETSKASLHQLRNNLAVQVTSSYLNLTITNLQILFYTSLLDNYSALENATTDPNQKRQVQLSRQSIESMRNNIALAMEELRLTFQELTSIANPENLQDAADVLEAIRAPNSPEEALFLAQKHSPSLQSSRSTIENLQHSREAARRSAYYPKVDLVAGRNFSEMSGDAFSMRSEGTMVGIQFSMALSPRSVPTLSAQQKEIAAAKADFDGAAEKLKIAIEVAFRSLIRLDRNFQRQLKTFENAKLAVDEVQRQISAGVPVEANTAIGIFSTYSSAYLQTLSAVMQFILARAQLMATVGIFVTEAGDIQIADTPKAPNSGKIDFNSNPSELFQNFKSLSDY